MICKEFLKALFLILYLKQRSILRRNLYFSKSYKHTCFNLADNKTAGKKSQIVQGLERWALLK